MTRTRTTSNKIEASTRKRLPQRIGKTQVALLVRFLNLEPRFISSSPLAEWRSGDSSMYGMFYENGPYLLNPDGKTLRENPVSWNKFVNILYIESPVGVGYSYSDDPNENATLSDDNSMEENYAALSDFVNNIFPEFQQRDLYVIDHRWSTKGELPVKFKGMATANGLIDYSHNINSMMHILYFHGLMPFSAYSNLLDTCCPVRSNEFECKFSEHIDWPTFPTPKYQNDSCFDTLVSLVLKYYLGSPNNGYQIYQDCYQQPVKPGVQNNTYPLSSNDPFLGYWCFMDDSLRTYMRQNIEDKYTKQRFTMRPYFDKAIEAKVKSLIYNGDTDLHCNHLGAEWFADEVATGNNLPVKQSRTEWYYQLDREYQKRMAGYQIKYGDYLDVITIKGAGHVSGADRPAQLFQLIYNFVNGNDYSTPVIVDPVDPTSTPKAATHSLFFFALFVIFFYHGYYA
ncbi:unnamed protein product, partial [Mesorhabditis belari]|uniref:Uncharacterized protein n=1 Tax=Mesorhabditis belari TaxID=2138241 RepID=A0AAF3F7N0_9BILA